MVERKKSAVPVTNALLIDALCERYERALKDNDAPRIEDLLNTLRGDLHAAALLELLQIEIEIRRVRGDPVGPEDYLQRFPELKSVVLDAFNPVDTRCSDVVLATVTQHIAPTPTLKVNNRSQISRSASSRLEVRCPSCHLPIDVAVDTKLTDITCSACGDHFSLVNRSDSTRSSTFLSKIGRFELIERLGVGGFGSVWKARDKEFDRTVAVKIPRAGDMTEEEQEKFFREARAAAQLRHPNIVSVHEVGREGESVYIVSDFVRGVTLGDWLTGQQLTGREAAELCEKISDALHHAHEQGVVHRDLKPANIMMDGDAQPHLMDFGLARREVGEVTVTTEGQILGTPAYMSPEQAQGEAHTADRRSDIYSLGVILFQLLTGERPFRGNARMIMHQVIHDEPRNPRSLNDRVPRDVDTICMKCLQKEPGKRYQRADELAAELERFRMGKPILARPVGRAERIWSWCRRNPVESLLAGMAVFLLLALVGVGSAGYVNTKRALREADANYDFALGAIDETLTFLGSDLLENVPQMEAARRRVLQKALVSYQGLLEKKPTDVKTRTDVAHAYYRVADIHRKLGEHKEAQDAYQQSIQRFKTLGAEFPDEPEHRNYLGMSYDYFGELLRDGSKVRQAEESYHNALAVQKELVRQFPDNDKYQQEFSRTLNNFGILLMETNRFPESEESFGNGREVLYALAQAHPDKVDYQQELARIDNNLGVLFRKSGRDSDAKEAYRRASDRLALVVEAHPEVPDYRYKLAVSLVNLSNVQKSADLESDLRRAVELLTKLSNDFPKIPLYKKELANAHNSLAAVYDASGKLDNARESFDAARGVGEQLVKDYPDNPEYKSLLGQILGGRGWLAEEQKDIKHARESVATAISLQQAALDANPRNPNYRKLLDGHRSYLQKLDARAQPES